MGLKDRRSASGGVHLSLVRLSVLLFIRLSVCVLSSFSPYLSVYLSVCSSVCSSVCPFVHLSVRLCVIQFFPLSVCPSVPLSIRPPAHNSQCACLYICTLCLFIRLSICPYVRPLTHSLFVFVHPKRYLYISLIPSVINLLNYFEAMSLVSLSPYYYFCLYLLTAHLSH